MSRLRASQSKLIKSIQELALKLLSFLSTDLELNFAFSCNMLFLLTSQTKEETVTEMSHFRDVITQFCGVFSAAGFERKHCQFHYMNVHEQ